MVLLPCAMGINFNSCAYVFHVHYSACAYTSKYTKKADAWQSKIILLYIILWFYESSWIFLIVPSADWQLVPHNTPLHSVANVPSSPLHIHVSCRKKPIKKCRQTFYIQCGPSTHPHGHTPLYTCHALLTPESFLHSHHPVFIGVFLEVSTHCPVQ